MSVVADLDRLHRGLISSEHFIRKSKYQSMLNAELDDVTFLECCLSLESFPIEGIDLACNRLLCGYRLNYITLHDVTPVYTKPFKYPQVGEIFSASPPLSGNRPTGNKCVRWRTYDCGLFSSSGNLPTLDVYDTETVSKVTSFSIPEAEFIHQHCYNSFQQCTIGCVAIPRRTHLIDLRSGSIFQTLTGNFDYMMSIVWSPSNENLLFTASCRGEIVAWDIRACSRCLLSDTLYTTKKVFLTPELEFDEFGNHLMCLSTDKKLREIDQMSLNNRVIVNHLKMPPNTRRYHYSVSSLMKPPLVFLPNGKYVSIYNLETGELVKNCIGHTCQVLIVKYNDINDEIYSTGDDNIFCVWKTIKEY